MEKRISNIMRALSEDIGIAYQELGNNKFELNTNLSKLGHKTFLKIEVTSDIIRTDLNHVFGALNLAKDISAEELLQMLVENMGSFLKTSAYLGVKIIEKTPYVALNAYHHFNMKWEDRDIADIISLQIFDISMGLSFWNAPDSISMFTKE